MTETNPRAFCLYYDGNYDRVKCRIMSPGEELPLKDLGTFFELVGEDDVISVVLFNNSAFDENGEEMSMEYVSCLY